MNDKQWIAIWLWLAGLLLALFAVMWHCGFAVAVATVGMTLVITALALGRE